jgi:steroid 5-alpha reductase family enzyme
MSILLPLLCAWFVMALAMSALWQWQRRRGNAGAVDVAWTFGVGVLAIVFAGIADGWGPRRFAVAALAGLWSLRLGAHLWKRVFFTAEDGRYAALEERWGQGAQTKLFWFFQAQAFWSALFSAPMLFAASNALELWRWLDTLGVAIGLLAIGGEHVADRQLARFRQDPNSKGRVMDRGLWAWSRHPNYFFEWLHWFAYVAFAAGGNYALWSWMGPVTMLFFLLVLTGVPHNEAQALRSRGDAYRAYQRRTSCFFPWPPRRTEQRGS